jgi:hypothetical protein
MLNKKEIEAILQKHFPTLLRKATSRGKEEPLVHYAVSDWIEFVGCYNTGGRKAALLLRLYTRRKIDDYKNPEDMISDLLGVETTARELVEFGGSFNFVEIKYYTFRFFPQNEKPRKGGLLPTVKRLGCRDLDITSLSAVGLEFLAKKIKESLSVLEK